MSIKRFWDCKRMANKKNNYIGKMVASRSYDNILLGMIIAHEDGHPYCYIIEWYGRNGTFTLQYEDEVAHWYISLYHEYKTNLGF